LSAQAHEKGLLWRILVAGIYSIMGECRSITVSVAVCLSAWFLPQWGSAAESWGGSLAVTSDYLVRGISRSNGGVAVQADLHVAADSGIIGGVFASSAQFDSGDHRDAELSAFVGFVWQRGGAWRTKALASYYSYPWNDSGSQYNYAELGFEAAYDDWLDIDVVYSPNAPRYIPHRGLTGVNAESADLTLRTPWYHRVAATGGVGYSHLAGPSGGGYAYWSAGGIMDLRPWSVSLSYVNTDAEAVALFYNAAAHNQWIGTIIWRF
jgi:uncharacterized protein (TIGR02001 family)